MVSLVVAYMVIVSYQFNAGGAVLEVIVGDKTILTARTATLIAAAFIITYAALAGLMSLAWMDLVTGSIIMLTMVIAFPIYWFKAGGWSGIESAFITDQRASHLDLWGVYSPTKGTRLDLSGKDCPRQLPIWMQSFRQSPYPLRCLSSSAS